MNVSMVTAVKQNITAARMISSGVPSMRGMMASSFFEIKAPRTKMAIAMLSFPGENDASHGAHKKTAGIFLDGIFGF